MKEIKKSVTMKDVARLAGVGVGTVSRVVNNEKGVKKVTLDKVHKAIKELDYLPDAYARGMKINKTETVALIIPTIWHPFFAEFSFYVENELSKQGYKLLLCNIDGDKKEIEYITMLKQNKVDGIIAITYSPIEDYLTTNIPFVSINRTYENKHIACVTSDNKAGAQLAAQKLIEKGCREIAFVGSHNSTNNETKNRHLYFEQYLTREGYHCHSFDIEEPFDNFVEQLEVFLKEHPQIDGIFAINDFVALDVIDLLEHLGKKVPDDVQVIGYDGIRLANERRYPVSTIKQPLELMAKEAVRMLLSVIDGESYPLQSVLPISFEEGPTTKK